MEPASVLSLRVAGMSWFDALCHAFSAMSLRGFSTHDSSVGYFDSVPIELVLTAFQVIAALNFATHYLAWRFRDWRAYLHDTEAKYVVGLLALSCTLIAGYLMVVGTYDDLANRSATPPSMS